MSKKKMCKEWNGDMETTPCNLNEYYSGTCHYRAFKKCNSKCEIITEPKPRMVRVKAWFTLCGGDTPWDVTFNPHMPKDTFKPCTVLIDRKYITTRNKGGK